MTMNTCIINCKPLPRHARPNSTSEWGLIKNQACVITKGVTNDNALKLRFKNIKDLLDNQDIELQESLESEDKVITSNLHDYIDYCEDKKTLDLNFYSRSTGITGCHHYTDEPIYLLSYNVNFDQNLKKYVECPSYITDWFSKYMPLYKDLFVYGKKHTWFFIGPKNTKSEMHTDHDFVHTTIQQIDGQKLFFIIPPKEMRSITRHNPDYFASLDFKLEGKTCLVSDGANDRDLEKLKTTAIYYTKLEPEDVLNIPMNWGHYAKSLSPSISVSRDYIDERNVDKYFCSILNDSRSFHFFRDGLENTELIPDLHSKVCEELEILN